MTDPLEKLERKAFRSYWDDGLLDTLAGLSLVVLGASWWQDVAVFGAVFPAVAFSMWHPLRKKLVDPRLGYVEFSGKRELKTRTFRHGMTAFLTGTMILGGAVYYSWNSSQFPEFREFVPGLPAILLALMALYFGAFTDCRRFYVHAAIMAAAGILTMLMNARPGPPMLAGGIVISVIGLTLLFRFISTHPADGGAFE